jgi:hypothetical protein
MLRPSFRQNSIDQVQNGVAHLPQILTIPARRTDIAVLGRSAAVLSMAVVRLPCQSHRSRRNGGAPLPLLMIHGDRNCREMVRFGLPLILLIAAPRRRLACLCQGLNLFLGRILHVRSGILTGTANAGRSVPDYAELVFATVGTIIRMFYLPNASI